MDMTVEQDHCESSMESSSGHDSSVNCFVSRPLSAANLIANESAIKAADIGSTYHECDRLRHTIAHQTDLRCCLHSSTVHKHSATTACGASHRLFARATKRREKSNTCLDTSPIQVQPRAQCRHGCTEHLDGRCDAELMMCSFVRVSADPAKMKGSRISLTRRD